MPCTGDVFLMNGNTNNHKVYYRNWMGNALLIVACISGIGCSRNETNASIETGIHDLEEYVRNRFAQVPLDKDIERIEFVTTYGVDVPRIRMLPPTLKEKHSEFSSGAVKCHYTFYIGDGAGYDTNIASLIRICIRSNGSAHSNGYVLAWDKARKSWGQVSGHAISSNN